MSTHFKQFLLGSLQVLIISLACKWVWCDVWLYCLNLFLLLCLILQAACFIVSDYHQRKLDRLNRAQAGGYHHGWPADN